MKKSRKTYILLGLVLAIWGVLGFRIVKTLNPPEEKNEVVSGVTADLPVVIKKRDTFSIAANYRDPFLGTLPKKQRSAKATAKKETVAPKRTIAYQGSVATNGTKSRLFFVTVDGQQHVFEKGKEIDGVTLIRGSEKSIKVKYNNHIETHSLNQ
ncbi:MAG: hypothetical protein AB3N16_08130 [Flavobacteriaceae bacterium]